MEIAFTAIASVAVGLAIGVLSGLIGVGGGTILVPVFKLAYGMPAIAATATSLFTIIPTSASGVVTHIRNKTCIPALGLAAGIGGACTSSLGVWLASLSPEWAIMVAAALVIGYSAATMLQKALKLWRRQRAQGADADGRAGADATEGATAGADVAEGAAAGAATAAARADAAAARVPSATAFPRIEGFSTRKTVAAGAAIGLGAGLVSGYVGVGGGFIMIPLFMQVFRMPMRLTSGTSLIAIMLLATPATIAQAVLGNIDWVAGICVALGTMPGAALGSRLIARVSELALRLVFSGFLFVAATLLVLNQLHVF